MAETVRPRSRLVVEGDSITASTTAPWVGVANARTGNAFDLPTGYNQAVGGETALQMIAEINAVTVLQPDVVVLLAGTNDLSATQQSASQIYATLSFLWKAYLTAGADYVVAVEILPRSDTGWQQIAYREADRISLNGLIDRLASDPSLAGFSDKIKVVTVPAGFNAPSDTVEGVHPNLAGAEKLGLSIGDVLGTLVKQSGSEAPHATSALVDAAYYLAVNSDVAKLGQDAARHYETYGWHEGRDPNPAFSTLGYLAANADVAKSGQNPLTHYDQHGWKEGRDPSAMFDNELYLARNPDVRAAGLDPLAHYLANGQAEGRPTYLAVGKAGDLATHPGFDAEYYLLANGDVAKAALASGGDSFVFAYRHYEAHGWHEGRNPNAVFDTKGYLASYGDVAAADVDPLAHYAQYGFKEGRDPSVGFDTKAYEAAYGDVKAAGLDPMLHYLQYGALEGRQAFADGHFG